MLSSAGFTHAQRKKSHEKMYLSPLGTCDHLSQKKVCANNHVTLCLYDFMQPSDINEFLDTRCLDCHSKPQAECDNTHHLSPSFIKLSSKKANTKVKLFVIVSWEKIKI